MGVEQVETPVFVMLKRDDCVYTQIVKHCSAEEFLIRHLSNINETEFR